jgi:hypothetical protein
MSPELAGALLVTQGDIEDDGLLPPSRRLGHGICISAGEMTCSRFLLCATPSLSQPTARGSPT